jgi:cysteine desulfurase
MNIKPETMIHAFDEEEIYLSTNTACSSGNISNAVVAVYNDVNRASHTIRISLSQLTTSDEINKFLDAFSKIYDKLNSLAKR